MNESTNTKQIKQEMSANFEWIENTISNLVYEAADSYPILYIIQHTTT